MGPQSETLLDLLLAGYRVRLAGAIAGDAVVEASQMELPGTVAGRLRVAHDNELAGAAPAPRLDVVRGLRWIVALLIAGLVVVQLAPQWRGRLGLGLEQRPFELLRQGAVSAVASWRRCSWFCC